MPTFEPVPAEIDAITEIAAIFADALLRLAARHALPEDSLDSSPGGLASVAADSLSDHAG